MADNYQSYTSVNIEKLPLPNVVESLDFEEIYQQQKNLANGLQPLLINGNTPQVLEAEIIVQDNGEKFFKVPANHINKLQYIELESEPSAKIIAVSSYREMLLRQRLNEATKAVMLAYALDADLDQIGANYDVARLVITPADLDATPPVEAVYESDENYRRRIQLSNEGKSTAGPEGAYVFHGLSADADVKDIAVAAPTFQMASLDPSLQAQIPDDVICLQVLDDAGLTDPMPGDVAMTILSQTGDGSADSSLQNTVATAVSADEVRPITDRVRTRSAAIQTYSIDAALHLFEGADQQIILQAAKTAIDTYVKNRQSIGLDVSLSGIYAALHVEGVEKVTLNSPSAGIAINQRQVPYCTNIVVTIA